MRVKGACDAGRQRVRRIGGTHSWNVEVQAFGINSMFTHDLRDEALAFWMVDESGFLASQVSLPLPTASPAHGLSWDHKAKTRPPASCVRVQSGRVSRQLAKR